MAVIDILADIAPEFADEDEAVKLRFISYAELNYAQSVLGDLYEMVIALMTAHLLTMRDRQGKGGFVNAAKEGQLGLNFSSSKTDGLFATGYGQELDALLKRKILAARTSSDVKI